MKNKGFTLIEVLAVISILAAVSLIVVPAITSSVSNSRKNVAKTSASNYINAIETYVRNQALERKEITGEITDLSEFDKELEYNGEGPDLTYEKSKVEIGSCGNDDDLNCYRVVGFELKFGRYIVEFNHDYNNENLKKEYKVKRG